MNLLKRVRLSRRAVLRGLGATVALPMLEAMLPAADAASAIPRRMGVFYFGTGMNGYDLFPKDTGPDFTLTPILKPLEPYRGDFTVLSGTSLQYGGGHSGDYTFLTGQVGRKQDGTIVNGISADQVVAARVGQATRFPSLQLSVARGTGYGGNLSTLSWNQNAVPLAAENDPHLIFSRLFKVDDAKARASRERGFQRRGSILDLVQGSAKQLETQVSRADREKLEEYFTSIREVEHQLAREKDWANRPKPAPDLNGMGDFSQPFAPGSSQFRYELFGKLMYDLIAMAFQTDSTRVVTYVVRRESAGGEWPEMNVSKSYHALTHHNNSPRDLQELTQVDTFYMRHWAHLLARLKAMKEPDGSTVLDHTMLAFSSGMGIDHSRDRLPTAVFGGKALGVKHQGHLKLADNTPLASLWHTMADRMGVNVGGEFQDSKGVIKQLVG